MTVPEIIAALAPKHPRLLEAFAEAERQKDEVTPALLGILKEAAADIEATSESESCAFVAAAYLLAQFREQKAFPHLIDLMRIPNDEDMLDAIWGTIMTEDYLALLRDTYDGNYLLLRDIIEHQEYSLWPRVQALEVYSLLLADGHLTRRELVRYLRHLLRNVYTQDLIRQVVYEEDDDTYSDLCYFISDIAWAVTENNLIEMIDDIKPFFETNVIGAFDYGTYDEFLKYVNGGCPLPREDRHISSAAESLSFWVKK
ncbi:MAG: DUF1186 family protein [Treponema sp.]|jgi:hypothetical protein|nr:DUF1186 family protein [Treponema sp.]